MTRMRKGELGANTPAGKRQLNVYINWESDAILKALLERDGVPYSAQVDRALRLFAKEKGIEVSHVTATRTGA